MASLIQNRTPRVLVSDFDGTMTRHDFSKLAIETLLPPDRPDHWVDYRAGRITHFEVLAVVDRMELDADLPQAIP